jgi:predicted ester cyclase
MDYSLRKAREAVVLEHIESENQHDFPATVGTFSRPRYEVTPTGEVHDGAGAVLRFLLESHDAFPNFVLTIEKMHVADDAIIVETRFKGRHTGVWKGLPPTGREVDYLMCNVFEFDGPNLVCERLSFDSLTILQQLGVARDPTTWAGRVEIALSHPLLLSLAWLRSIPRKLGNGR